MVSLCKLFQAVVLPSCNVCPSFVADASVCGAKALLGAEALLVYPVVGKTAIYLTQMSYFDFCAMIYNEKEGHMLLYPRPSVDFSKFYAFHRCHNIAFFRFRLMEKIMLEPEDDENSLDGAFLPDIEGEDYPLWRDNGATAILSKSLDDVVETFKLFIEEGCILVQKLLAHITDEKYFYHLDMFGSAPDEKHDFFGKFDKLQGRLERFARTALVMAVIDLEARINKFCFYNLGEVTTAAIENLSLTGKLEIIHKVLGLAEFKGTSQYAAVRHLVKWRNAFVHGKCTDMPVNSIKENHIARPKKFRGSRNIVEEALEHLRYYYVIYSHLNKISKHPYTSKDSTFDRFDLEPIETSGDYDAYRVHPVPFEETLRRIEDQFNNATALIKEIEVLMGYEQST